MDKFEFAQRLQSDKARYYRIAYSYVKNEQDALDIVGDATYKGAAEPEIAQESGVFRDLDDAHRHKLRAGSAPAQFPA